MGLYDADQDCVRADERFIGRCARCGREMLKKRMVTMMVRRSYANPKTVGFFCPDCYTALCEEYEIKDGDGCG